MFRRSNLWLWLAFCNVPRHALKRTCRCTLDSCYDGPLLGSSCVRCTLIDWIHANERMKDFFDGVDRLLQSTPANEISLHHSYSRSALKKILKDHGAKDMRKAVETMSRRVDKHFADDEEPNTSTANTALINMVWNELTQEFAKEILRAQGIVAKSYGDSGLGLEFSAADVEATCKKMK